MESHLPETLPGLRVYMVGIKGTGMAAFAEVLTHHGALVQGSDVSDRFFTDEILESLGLKVFQGFSEDNLQPDQVDFVIHSAAYSPENHPELIKARLAGLPMAVYTQALGDFSRRPFSCGIAGVHGKTTTTALAGVILRALGVPSTVLVGSLVPDFGNRATLNLGREFFVAETCEYRRHFLSFHPQIILLTSIELDHTDYFKDLEDISFAFKEYALKIPPGGVLIYCEDDPGAQGLAMDLKKCRKDLSLIGYGKNAEGDFKLQMGQPQAGKQSFSLAGWQKTFDLTIPGIHNQLNANGALALGITLFKKHYQRFPNEIEWDQVRNALESFRGSRRRSQIVGQRNGVLVMDDYAHHPTAIKTTLEGIKAFYPDRRLVVDFMSHTFSRTKSLLKEFSESFSAADEVVLHGIYASAREAFDPEMPGIRLAEETRKVHKNVKYFEGVLEALPYYQTSLKDGDLLLTMGAGDNWKVGLEFLKGQRGGSQ